MSRLYEVVNTTVTYVLADSMDDLRLKLATNGEGYKTQSFQQEPVVSLSGTEISNSVKEAMFAEILNDFNYEYDFTTVGVIVYAQERERRVQFSYPNVDEALWDWLATLEESEDPYWLPYIAFISGCAGKKPPRNV